MRLCLIVEERYRGAQMPIGVADQLAAWGHEVEVLEPQRMVTCLTELHRPDSGGFDAVVLKTVSDGPGRTLIDAAAAAGITTVNDARAIQVVREKAVAATVARAHGLPFPSTWFLPVPELLSQVPAKWYPLVIKPSNGSDGRGVRLIISPAEARLLDPRDAGFLLAQPFVVNSGTDIKLYNTGHGMFAVRRPSPLLHGDVDRRADEIIPLNPDLRALGTRIGRVFGLDIYGVDLLETANGYVAVDVNDFPSFSVVPEAVTWVAETIVEIAGRRRDRDLGYAHRLKDVTVSGVPVPRFASHRSGGRGMRVLLLYDRPDHPVLDDVVTRLRRRHRVDILCPAPDIDATAEMGEVLDDPPDLVLLKSHSASALGVAAQLETAGCCVVNGVTPTAVCRDRVAMVGRLAAAGVPQPRIVGTGTLMELAAQPEMVATLPVVVKSRISRRGDVVVAVHDATDLKRLTAAWSEELVIVQERVDFDGWDVKLWAVGRHVFAARRPSPLDGGALRTTLPLDAAGLPEDWLRILRSIGSAFELDLYGIDVVLTPQGPVVVDVNAFPGYRDVSGAAAALVAWIEARGQRVEATA